MLPAIRISRPAHDSSNTPPTAAIIMLHGLGSGAEDFRGIVDAINLPSSVNTEFIFPQAPRLSVTINAGRKMPAWFDIFSFKEDARQDSEGIQRASEYIDEIVADLYRHGVKHQHIFVGGFSQGGAVALHYASHHPQTIAGVVAISTYLPLITEFPQAVTDGGRKTPIFMSHGSYDEIIPLNFALASHRALEQEGFEIAWREYPCGHSLALQTLHDLSQWLAQKIQA